MILPPGAGQLSPAHTTTRTHRGRLGSQRRKLLSLPSPFFAAVYVHRQNSSNMSHLMQTTAKQTKGALQLKEISIIPITTAAVTQPPADKASSSSMADDDSADSLRKKRCTDRYDSSESSDRYVPRISFIKRFREDYRMSLRGSKVLISFNELLRTLSPAKTFKKLSIISFADLSILQATREQKSFLEAQADELKSRIHRSVQLSFGASITIKRKKHRGNLR